MKKILTSTYIWVAWCSSLSSYELGCRGTRRCEEMVSEAAPSLPPSIADRALSTEENYYECADKSRAHLMVRFLTTQKE